LIAIFADGLGWLLNEEVVALCPSSHNPHMKTATQLSNCIQKNLKGPLGPTPTAFAIRQSLRLILELREHGASWAQIAHPINVAFKRENRGVMSADTLRGLVARELRGNRPEQTSAPPAKRASTASALPSGPGIGSTVLMKGESEKSKDGSLDQAASIAAVLEQMKGI